MNLLPKMVSHFTLIEIIFYGITPKNLLFFHISVNIIHHPLFPITLILNRIKIFILTLPPDDNKLFALFQSHTSNLPILFPEPNTLLLHTNTFLFLLFHTIELMLSQTLLTPTPKSSIIFYIIPLPFHKHSLVLLTRLNAYVNLPPILPLHPLIFELPILRIIYAPFLLKTTTLGNLVLVSHLETMLPFVIWITC